MTKNNFKFTNSDYSFDRKLKVYEKEHNSR